MGLMTGHSKAAGEICRAFGLLPERCISLKLSIPANDVATVEVMMYATEEQAENVCKILTKYKVFLEEPEVLATVMLSGEGEKGEES
jgi:hypothetical protein